VLEELLKEYALEPDQVAVMGDDVVDIPLFRRVGIGSASLRLRKRSVGKPGL